MPMHAATAVHTRSTHSYALTHLVLIQLPRPHPTASQLLINHAIRTGAFEQNPAFAEAIRYIKVGAMCVRCVCDVRVMCV